MPNIIISCFITHVNIINMNKKKLWFKAKNYGWGWYPATWQGFLITFIYFILLMNRAFVIDAMFDSAESAIFRMIFEFGFLTIILILICYLKGEKPEWRWGGKRIKV